MATLVVQHVDQKLPGVAVRYELWNEPDAAYLCAPPTNSLQDKLAAYEQIYAAPAPAMRAQATQDAATQHVPDTIGIGGSALANPDGHGVSWTKALLTDNPILAKNLDFISYHE
jgi:hypothetical protein